MLGAPALLLLMASLCFQGLEDVSDEDGELLGMFTYQEDGEALQTFALSVSSRRAPAG